MILMILGHLLAIENQNISDNILTIFRWSLHVTHNLENNYKSNNAI